jgi:large subunit ribosomal protein L23
MGIFGSKKKEEAVEAKPKAVAKTAAPKAKPAKSAAPKAKAVKSEKTPTKEVSKVVAGVNASANNANLNNRIIIRPRITEKATMMADSKNVFVFEVSENATKGNVRRAVASIYNVTPVKVAMTRNPGKQVYYRGRIGNTSGVKKAYVHLKAGDKIEII